MLNIRRKIKISAVIIGVVFLFVMDRILKILTLEFLHNQKVDLIGGWLSLDLFKNNNLAFSLPMPAGVIIFITIIIISILIYYFVHLLVFEHSDHKQVDLSKKNGFNVVSGALLLIIFGAISNLYDRIHYSYVIDYINLSYCPTVFNVADVMICVGIIFLAIKLFKK